MSRNDNAEIWHEYRTVNTITNVSYLIVAPIAFVLDGIWPYLACAAMVGLAVGSGLWHWTGSRLWNLADEIGMYAAFSVLVCLWLGLPWWAAVLVAAGLAAGAPYFASDYVLGVLGGILFGAMVGRGAAVWAWADLGLFVLAYVFWRQDRGILEARGPFHGAWHITTALVWLIPVLAYSYL